MISINEDEILVVFKKDCIFAKAMEILYSGCYPKDSSLWDSNWILIGTVRSYYKNEVILRKLNSDYKEFVETAVYNYEDSRYIK